MELHEAKEKFINEWGCLSSNWGICKTMGQLHALLLVTSKEICAEDIMHKLQISRGNVNMNLRALIDWGLVYKVNKIGERKDYFEAEKDIWKVFKQIVKHRKKKELEPMVKVLNELDGMEANCDESNEFCRMVRELKLFSEKADSSLEAICESKNNWLLQSYIKMLR
jgi:DNA-binding transcriptional regulator GbsR (MarR family)